MSGTAAGLFPEHSVAASVGEEPKAQYQALLKTLEDAIKWLRYAAVVVFALGIVGAGVAFSILPAHTDRAARMIADNEGNVLLGLFELLRTAAFAGLVAAVLFGTLTLGRACLDQATRYQKRLMAALFMHYVLDEYRDQLRDNKVDLGDVVKFIDVWSKNVESAFTKVKFGTKGTPTMQAEVDPSTGKWRLRTDDAAEPPEPKK